MDAIDDEQDRPLRQVIGEIGRGILDDVHQSLAPRRPRDLLPTGVWILILIVLRINIEVPADWPDKVDFLVRSLLSWLLAVNGTLFLAHLVFYVRRGLAAVRRRPAA